MKKERTDEGKEKGRSSWNENDVSPERKLYFETCDGIKYWIDHPLIQMGREGNGGKYHTQVLNYI